MVLVRFRPLGPGRWAAFSKFRRLADIALEDRRATVTSYIKPSRAESAALRVFASQCDAPKRRVCVPAELVQPGL